MPSFIGYPKKLSRRKVKEQIDGVSEARQKLDYGKSWRQEKREDLWRQSEDQYLGRHWGDTYSDDPTADLITVNMSFSTVNTIVPYMTGSEPQFLVMPYSGEATVFRARLQQAFLNRLWRSSALNGQAALEDAAVDFLLVGDGYLKVGFDIVDKRLEDDTYAEIAEIYVDRVDPWDLWIDPTADGLHNARWVCQRLRITRRELEDNQAYTNIDEYNVTYGDASTVLNQEDVRTDKLHQEVFDGSEYAVVYEFYDLVKDKMIVFSDGELPLRWIDDIGGLPIIQLPNYRIPKSPYHMGELEQLWDLQRELNKTRSQMITHRRRNVQKFIAKRDALDEDAIDALQSSIVNDVAFVTGDSPLDSLVSPVQIPNLSADIYNVSDVMMRDIYEISGVNEYLRGATPEIRRTATEATIIEGASNIKSQFKLRQIEKASRQIGTTILKVAKDVFPLTDYEEMQMFLTGREAEQIQRAQMGEQMAQMMDSGQADPMMIAQMAQQSQMKQDVVMAPAPDIWVGDYEVEVEQASTELRNPVMKAQKYRELVNDLVQMAPILMQLGVTVNLQKPLEQWFEAIGIDDIDAMFEPNQGMPMQQPGMPPQGGGQPGPPGFAQGQGQPNPQAAGPEAMGAFTEQNTGQNAPA